MYIPMELIVMEELIQTPKVPKKGELASTD